MEKIAGNFGVISRFTRSSALGARWRPRRTIEGRRQKRRLPSSRALPCCLILPCWSRPGAPRASFMGTSDKLRGNFCGRRLGSTDFRLWIFCGSAGEKPHRLNRLRKKAPTPFCHSERSEESLFLFMELNRREILRFAQNDKINYFFRSLFSLPVFVCTSKFKTDRLKPALLEAVQPAVDSQESGIGQHCKNDQNQDERHDRGYVAQVDRVHQKEADALLRGAK